MKVHRVPPTTHLGMSNAEEGLVEKKIIPFWARPTFWASVMAGITAPSMLFAPSPSYTGMIRDFSVAGSFAAVGALMSKSAREQA